MTDDVVALQAAHERDQAADPGHDRSSCWCCCVDCPDLDPAGDGGKRA